MRRQPDSYGVTRLAVSLAALLAAGCGSSERATSASMPDSGSTGGAAGSDAGDDRSSNAPPYSIMAFESVRIGSDPARLNFQKASAAIDLRDGPFESVRLIVDLDTTCFPFESWQNNPPPPGHRWPADCDAFDRNFELSLDDPALPDSQPPGIELVRAITPFGGPMQLDVDVTDVANGRSGQRILTVRIATFSDSTGQVSGSNGGWNVSARLEVLPGTPPRRVLGITPLFYDNVERADIEPLSFETPEATTRTRLEYRATGHGAVAFGCGFQTAEEFCLRTHTLFVDGSVVSDLQPWRSDCASLCTVAHNGSATAGFDYCAENPCGALDSVRASRANWCPGSVTPPYNLELEQLSRPGPHDLRWQISDVADGATWRLSALFFAFGD